jgi:large-conductance mechanosensitive channel
VLKPIINWILALILGKGSLSEVYTFLGDPVYMTAEDGSQVVDLANSFYIDWGSLINAIINFLLIAIVLFTIVKVINGVKEKNQELKAEFNEKHLDKNERKELRAAGIKLTDRAAVKAYYEEKAAKEAAEKEEAKKIEEEKAAAERLANPTTEDLLKSIKELLEKSVAKE